MSISRARQTQELYSDLAFGFNPQPVSGDVMRHINEEAVKRSIKNIVLTDFYERPYRPTFGCNVRKLLFENFGPETDALIKSTIESALENWEPRAKILSVVVSGNPDSHEIGITIIFSVINREQPITFQFYLDRVR
jgi:phage baseplate assembly protein W